MTAKPKSPQENAAYRIRAAAKARAAHGVQWLQIDDPEEQLGDGIVARTAVEYLREAAGERKPFSHSELCNLAGDARLAPDLAMMQELLARFPRFQGPIPSTAQSRDYD